jgi:hypothetical protein
MRAFASISPSDAASTRAARARVRIAPSASPRFGPSRERARDDARTRRRARIDARAND